jgi:hypothetical protein
VVIHYDYAVIALVCGLDGANLGAWWLITVVAQQNHRLLAGFRAGLVFNLDFPDPVYVPAIVVMKSHVILIPARFQACRAARSALVEID